MRLVNSHLGEGMSTLQAIQARIDKLQKQAQALASRERSKAVQKVMQLMGRLGVTVDDLPRRKRAKVNGATTKKTVGVPIYRDPATGKTWTGHGRAPDWIRAASDRTVFLIDKSAADSGVTAGKKGRPRKVSPTQAVNGANSAATKRSKPRKRKATGAKSANSHAAGAAAAR
jgi:DNA-binding protein H-NS